MFNYTNEVEKWPFRLILRGKHYRRKMLLCSCHLRGQTLGVPTDSQVEIILPSVESVT